MNVLIHPLENGLNGTLTAPPSKSYSHRVLIAAALANGKSIIRNPLVYGDVSITLDILKKLGVKIDHINKYDYVLNGIKIQNVKSYRKSIDCGNSGTSIRIFSALSLLIEGGLKFKGEFLRRKRPIIPLLESLRALGADYKLGTKKFSIYRKKKICEPKISVQANVTSQFVTALLFLCPIIKCKSLEQIDLEISTPIASRPYIGITLNVLERFHIKISEKPLKNEKVCFKIPLNQNFKEQEFFIPGDFSSAAFIIAATILNPNNSKVKILNLDIRNPQGDKAFIQIIKKMGAKIKINTEENSMTIFGNIKENPLKGVKVNCKHTPDLFPILSILGIFAKGKTVLYGASNLRKKESDRLAAMSRELKSMGVQIIEKKDSLTIFQSDENVFPKKINHYNDHRVAMALSIAALYGNSKIEMINMEVIKDSYPEFFEDLINLGAKIEIPNK
jgi:3-phosphoshikimate 1-carboxyvinyltransferase